MSTLNIILSIILTAIISFIFGYGWGAADAKKEMRNNINKNTKMLYDLFEKIKKGEKNEKSN